MFRHQHFGHNRFFQGFDRESPFSKGDLKYVILDLLSEKSRYGYDIIRALEQRSYGFYSPSPGVVYPTLQMLEELGYASSAEQDGKKVYTITEEGRKFLSEQKDLTEKLKHHMRRRWNPKNIAAFAGMMREFSEMARIVRQGAHHTTPEKIERIREVIYRASSEIKSILEE